MRDNPDWEKMTDEEILNWMRPPGVQQSGLRDFCSQFIRPGMTVLEVGCFAGASTRIIAASMQYKGKLHCIDWWLDCWGKGNDKANRACEKTFDLLLFTHPEFIVKVKESITTSILKYPSHFFDVVYIDANHDLIGRDISLCLDKVKYGGVIGGHDYSHHWSKVIDTVNHKFGGPDFTFSDSSWAVCL